MSENLNRDLNQPKPTNFYSLVILTDRMQSGAEGHFKGHFLG